MAALVNRSLALFEEYKDHPVVKALVTFLGTQSRKLVDVETWSCELEKVSSNHYYLKTFAFDVLFKDNTGYKGDIYTMPDGTCTVHIFRHYYIFTGEY